MEDTTKGNHELSSALENIKSLMRKSKALVYMRSNILDLTQVVNNNTSEMMLDKEKYDIIMTEQLTGLQTLSSRIANAADQCMGSFENNDNNSNTKLNKAAIPEVGLQKKSEYMLPHFLEKLSQEQVMELVREILYTELKVWLNSNLPTIVREIVEKQVQLLVQNSSKE